MAHIQHNPLFPTKFVFFIAFTEPFFASFKKVGVCFDSPYFLLDLTVQPNYFLIIYLFTKTTYYEESITDFTHVSACVLKHTGAKSYCLR